ncbi:hypothetical protein PGB90_003458 [Kerria lacca]
MVSFKIIFLDNELTLDINHNYVQSWNETVSDLIGLPKDKFYLLCNGKKLQIDAKPVVPVIHVIPRIRGGKGGFGSMLRAIGAQIEKTTNREACRDLSGRRLRDINEEKRLKTWLSQKEEREYEAEERKRKKLERLCQEPKIELKDESYFKQRSELPQIIHDSVEKGLKVNCSGIKRHIQEKTVLPKKKRKGLLDEFEEDISEESSDSDLETTSCSNQNNSTSGSEVAVQI